MDGKADGRCGETDVSVIIMEVRWMMRVAWMVRAMHHEILFLGFRAALDGSKSEP